MSVEHRVRRLEKAAGDGTPVITVCWSDGTPFDTRSAEALSEAHRRGETIRTIKLQWEVEHGDGTE